ncbi:FAD-dependent oxidoreductase [candidate division KSB1 bacterium]|nr:FAD-dependent oxidoreductase [candidate division KSB1 bacterium]
MNFKKIFQTPKLILFFTFILFACSLFCKQKNHQVFFEAETFENKGGWLVDPQFVEQMGSPYLLAHGLGVPVENASKKITFPTKGLYYTWVRTKNWAPGNWETPGQFRLIVDQIELDNTLGSEPGWHWQFAGKVKIEQDTSLVELKDLSGFDGRCDAIYFCSKKQAPPNEKDDLKKWRQKVTNESAVPLTQEKYDVVIVGGGIAGCAAAIASAEQGLNVALIHDRPILGGNASSEIRVHTEGIPWHSERIISMINTKHYPNGSPLAKLDDHKRHQNIEKHENIHLFLQWRAYGAIAKNYSIKAVDARHTETGDIKRFIAPVYIDCTGDGWIGCWAGAEFMYGREPASKFDEYWEKYGELWSPAKGDNQTMGSSILWRTTDAGELVEFPEVNWAMAVAGRHGATAGTWQWEFSRDDLHQIDDAETIRDHLLKAIYGSFYNAKQKSENKNLKLEWVSYLVGKRESRRLVGDYIYTFKDVTENREFEDTVVMEKRPVDVHYQQNLKDQSKPDFLSEALYYYIDHYYIPYRCLYSKDINNLLMAGRCFSCSHIGLGGPRVMHTTGQMGVAVGYAASLCKKYDTTPRGVYEKHIKELQKMIQAN